MKADRSDIEDSLRFLSQLIFKHHGIEPWVLIDDYDAPILSGYSKYFERILLLMMNMYGAVVKDNAYLQKAVMTGVKYIPPGGNAFASSMNNVMIFSLLDEKFSSSFGFTDDEVKALLEKFEMTDKTEEVRKYYDGY